MRTQQNWWRHQQRLLELWEIILAGARAWLWLAGAYMQAYTSIDSGQWLAPALGKKNREGT